MVPVIDKACAIADPVPSAAPETPDSLKVQVKIVPGKLLVNAIEVVFPVQMLCDEGVAVITGVGLTVITTLTGVPSHPLADGMIV